MASDDNKSARRVPASVTLPVAAVQNRILLIRGHKVMLDGDLAALYEVETKALIQAVKRNITRFPDDFMFQLNTSEFAILRSQSVTSSGEVPAQGKILRSQSVTSSDWGGRRTPPYAFTEQGVAMLSSVLRSGRAAAVNVAIMRAFVQMREVLSSHAELSRKVDELERRMIENDDKRDVQIGSIIEAIRQLMQPPTIERRPVGFALPPDDDSEAVQQ